MRIGIIGAGSMGQVHAAAWLEAGAQVVAVNSGSLESALGLAAQYGARVCSSLAELLEHSDVVDLCVPTHLHHAMTLEAAMRRSLEELDGVFTYICVTKDALGVCKDELAAKPLVLFESDDLVALASEEIAIRAIIDLVQDGRRPA